MKNRRRLWIVLATVCTFLICAGLCVGLILHRESELDDIQNEALEELRDHRGEYDEKSIVLYDTNRGEAQALAEKFGAKLRISFDGKFATLTLPGDVTVEDIYSARGNRKYIADMALDYQVKTSEITDAEEDVASEHLPTRPQYSVSDEDYALQGYLDYLNMKDVWNWSTGYNVTVAVIDTGIDTDHPEFAGRISEYSYNATEDKIVKDYLLEDGSYDWSLVEDEQGHGTAVTGVIAASMNEGKVVGIAPSVTIITIKAECDENGRFARTSDLVFGLYYAIERDVDVVNMSFGVQSLINPFAEATQLALDSDVICVAAAGNEGTASLSYPAADPNVFGVGALEADGWNLASYSNYGENINLVAPGTTYTTLMGGKYGTMNGTSLASPVVTGAIALYLSANRYQEFLMVEEVLYASCYDLGDLGCDYYYGYGALDISALIMEERGTVTFNMMTDELENTEQLFIRDHTLQNMPEPERLYAIFDGWYYDPYGTEEYNWYTDKFSTDLTLYAKWVNEEDGIPFTYVELEDGTIEIRSYIGHRRYITIPDMIDGKIVSSIGEEAFKGETRLREVILPKELKRIRRSAFEGCNNLVHIDLPDTVIEIGEKAFYNNVRLSYVGVGGGSQLASIGNFAFSNCAKLQRFELPAGVVSVNGSAFYGATNLTAFTVRAGNKNFTAKDGVLFNYTQSTLVAYPAGLREEYTIPATVLTIGDYAFGYMRFAGINLGNVQTIGNFAFANSELESIVIPDTVTAMGVSAFEANFYLRSVQLGNGLTAISKYAFSNCTALEQITIPANIREIQSGAFANTLGMTSVTFAPDSKLTAIGASAFASSSLSSVAIPASVISIGDAAFAQHPWAPLASVTFAENSQLRTIGAEAFKGTYRLTSIDLPEQLTSIGAFAFSNSGLEQVTIPASLTSLGAGAFAACHNLTDINVEDANTVYVDVDGVVYDQAKTTLIAYPAGNARSDYSVLATVTAIEEDAFYGSYNLYTVYLPESLQEIRREAFYDCRGLNYIQIPDNVMQISNLAFAQCWNLSSVYLNDTSKLPRISYEAFAYCGLYSFRVPANVFTMAQGAFEGCANLTSFTFAANSKLESISAYMFDGCDNLQNITFEEGSALTSIQAHGFEGMRKLTSVDFGDAKITNIDNFAFRFCESLTRVDIPEGVTEIGRYAFYYCTSLSEISIPASVEFIGRFAFLGTKNLSVYFASETLPAYLQEDWDYGTAGYYLGVTDVITDGDWKYAKLTSGGIAIIQYNGTQTNIDLTALDLGGDIVNIGGEAFAYSTVENVVLPETLVTIQNEAFYHSALKAISIPASVDFIGRSAFADTPIETLTFASNAKLRVMEQSAFEGTKNLASITLPKSLTTIGRSIFKNSGITSLTFEDGIGITEISEEAFAYTNITTVTIPDSVTLLNHSAFRETKQLKSVDFGNSDGIMIMSNVFYHSGLTNLHIPTNVTYVGEYAFVALTNLQSFTVDADHPQYRAIDGLLVTKDGRKLIAAPAGREGTLTVPAGIEVIGFGAFEESKLTKINFLADANILSFGYRAFYGSAITEMHVPASVVAIDYYAFATCENLTKVTFAEDNQLRGIYEGAFYACPNLYDITLPDAIVEISDFAFYGCKKIDKLPVSDTSTIKGIYDYAFAYTGLEGDFTTPETLIDIGTYAFMGNKFTSVTVPDTNAYDLVIGIGAFEGCNSLQEITLPFIGASFEDPDYTWFGYIFGAGGYEANSTYVPESLKRVTITEGISVIGFGAFYELNNLRSIDIPYSVTTLYPTAFFNTSAVHEFKNTMHFVDKHGVAVTTLTSDYVDGQIGVCWPDGEGDYIGTGIFGHLIISDGITRIGTAAFNGCDNLMRVTLPEGLTSIGQGAFSSCISLTEITIPQSVTVIEDNAFPHSEYSHDSGKLFVIYNNSNLNLTFGSKEHGYVSYNAKLIVNKNGNKFYRDDESGFEYIDTNDGFRFMKEYGKYTLIEYFGNEKNVTLPADINGELYDIYLMRGVSDVVIPKGISTINSNAFTRCNTLVSISIADSVEKIDSLAFWYCTNLQTVSFGINSNLKTLGDQAFAGCVSLNDIVLPNNVDSIPAESFRDCYKLESVTIPKQCVSIGSQAFGRCSNLKSIYIGENVQTISGDSFFDCYFDEFIIDPNNQYLVEKDGVIYNKDVTKIFFALNGVREITIPVSVTDIWGAFLDHKTLERVRFSEGSQLTEIGGSAFAGCEKLNDIEIPSTIVNIGYYAFHGCAIEAIEIPESVKVIQDGAFFGCERLKSVKVSDTTDIARNAFPYGLALISNRYKFIDGAAAGLYDTWTTPILDGVVYSSDGKTIITADRSYLFDHLVIPDGVTTIQSNAFNGCDVLYSVTIPSSASAIAYDAFSACNNLYIIYNNSDIEISFEMFSNLKVIVDKYGNKTYQGDLDFEYIETTDGFKFKKEQGVYKLVAYLGTEETVTLPTEINGCSYEIYSLNGIKNVIIPGELIYIPDRRIGTSKLESVTILDGVTSIGWAPFYFCENLVRVTIPDSVQYIAQYAFYGCSNLAEITIGDDVRDVASMAFEATAYYNDLDNWQDGALYIGNHLIKVREDAEHLVVRPNTKSVANLAFEGCYKLKHLTIGGDLPYALGDYLTNLETLVITEMPNSVHYYFWDMPITLKNIVLADGVCMNKDAFSGITGVTIYVEANEKDVRWDENFPGWNAGNRMVYGDGWINATFYDANGNLVSSEIFTTSQVIRLPQIPLPEAEEGYIFVVGGWDLDGDGIADAVPATSTVDIHAHPIIKKEQKTYKIVFYAEDGKTVIASYILAHGAAITPPEVADKQGYITDDWIGYYDGLTATRNTEFILNRTHVGGDHTYGEPVWVAPTCTEKGYNKHICSVCGEWYATDEVEPLGHSYTENRIEPNCLTDGSVTYHCNTCGDEYTEILPAEGHAYTAKLIKDSTCTKLGEMQFTCTVCGDTQTEPIALKAHDYQKKYASKWWLQWLIEHILNIFFGYEGNNPYYFECVDCGHIQTAAESAGSGSASVKDVCEHQLSDWTKINDASCLGYATEGRICSVCNQVIEARTQGELGEHIPNEAVVENRVEPDCENDGSYDNVVYCSVCQAEINRETKVIAKLGHDYSVEWTVDIAPTCTTVGSKSHHCTKCDDKADITEISATGHSFSEWDVFVFPSCEENGNASRYCYSCGAVEDMIIDPVGHTNAIPVVENQVDATCTNDGSYDSVTYCSVCQAEINRETKVIEKLGHNEILHSGKSATCTTAGWKEYVTCSRCDHTTYGVIEALGHDEIHHSGKAPTCTEYGWEEYVTCSRCDYSTYAGLPAAGHKASEWIIDEEATYEKDGHKHKECTVCGEILEESIIPMLSHTYVSVVTPPTCTEQGYTTHTCSDCGNSYVDDYVPATGHSWSGWYETQAPTCTATGIDERECSACHEKETRTTDALGHTNATPVVENRVDATCTNDGHYDSITYCSVCQAEISRETKIIAKLGHDYSIEWTVDVTPTCTTAGSKSHHCTRCNDKADITEISETGHTLGNWKQVKAPTCTEKGSERRVCANCDYFEARDVDALGHTNATPVVENRVDATCTVNGQYDSVIYCTVCQAEISRETKTIVKLGHDYSIEWTVDVAPTCTTVGSKSHHCTRCDDKADVTEISATGHTLGSWTQVKAPTCTEKGSERRACANCDYFEERQVNALGHNYASAVTAPTCTEKGYTTHECTRCNAGKYVDSYVDALGHSFTNYVSNNDATYTEDGTKTAKCDRCNEKNTITDEGSALGMAQKFRDEMAALNKNADTETTYSELYAVLQTYTSLSAKEKEDVAKEFATLQQMINAYNAKAQTANNELAKATENAFAPIAVTSFTFLAALWFLLRKKFLV